MNKIFKQSMEVGYYFSRYFLDDVTTQDWSASEECSTFTKCVVDYGKENKCDIKTTFDKISNEIVDKIEKETIRTEDHMWDDYCKGFLAGEIIGLPTKENMKKIKRAENLWNNDIDKYGEHKYGYYHEVLEIVADE